MRAAAEKLRRADCLWSPALIIPSHAGGRWFEPGNRHHNPAIILVSYGGVFMLNHIEKTGDDEYTIIVVGIVNLNRADCGIAITGDRNPTITGSSNAGPSITRPIRPILMPQPQRLLRCSARPPSCAKSKVLIKNSPSGEFFIDITPRRVYNCSIVNLPL